MRYNLAGMHYTAVIKRAITVLGIIGVFFVGFMVGSSPTQLENRFKNDAMQYPYISQRVLNSHTNDMIINLTPLREVMNARYNEKKVPLGVYFEYLPTGSSIGINDQYQVEIASLSKVPAVMAVYRQIETGNLHKDTLLTIKKEYLNNQFGDLWKRGEDTQLKVGELIDYTLKKSDNTAANTIVAALPKGALEEVFSALDLPKSRVGPYPVMSPKSYASVFRNLYLASYVSRDSSQEILDKLAKTDFKDKLPAGVPVDVNVSHKIGVFRVKNVQDIYSDCGIVYAPSRPYLLCVMAAADEDTARAEIAAYSKMVYSYIRNVKPANTAR